MELSRTIASVAVVLAVILAAGHAYSEAVVPVPEQPTAQQKLEQREAQRRVAVEEQQKRKDAFERACSKPMKSDSDRDHCRTAYKRLQVVP
jgi:flagellar biosynthesis/type III secretory pathway M-ring protein FliF/YscJ